MATINLLGKVPLAKPYNQGVNYFLHDASLSENPAFYKKVLSGAKKSISILDPYAFQNDATRVFECIHTENLTIDVITTRYEEKEIKSFADTIINIIKKNVSTCLLNIISYKDKGVTQDQRIPLWHDRYLIIDKTDYYLIGSSLDAQQISKKHHGMFLLTEAEDIKIIDDLYVKYRNILYNSCRAYKTSKK